MDAHAGMHSIDGIVPLSEMFGYATDLRSKTQGRGTYTMQFAHYEEVPAEHCGQDSRQKVISAEPI